MELSTINDFAIFSIISVVIFATFKAMEKYPSAPFGTRYIYCGFFLILLNKVFFANIQEGDFQLISLSLFIHFVGIASIITGGIKFKVRNYKPVPLFILISLVGGIISYYMCFVVANLNFVKNIYIYSLSFGLFVLGIVFLLRPKMEKTGGYFISSFSLLALSFYYLFQQLEIGKQILASFPFDIAILGIFIIGLVMINGNVMWYQMEFLLSDVKKSKDRLRTIIGASPFPIVISKLRDDNILLINDKAGETFGIDPQRPENFKTIDFFADAKSRKDLISALENNSEVENFEVALKKTNSTETFWMLTSSRVIDFEQEIALYSAFQDISEIKEKEHILFDQATRDPLTNCYNRRQFEELANKELYKTSRNKINFTIVMVDADHFKKVNDTYGHATGDIVLKELADCCRNTLRESDIVARFGGEEFVLLLPETTADLAYTVCDRLREKISELEIKGINGESVSITVSMGLAESSTAESIPEMIEVADAALYIAKQTGRNRLVLGEKGMNMTNIDTGEFSVSDKSKPSDKNDDLNLKNEDEETSEIEDIPLDKDNFIKPKSIWDEDDE